jgi:hypothetical protein
LDGVDWLMDAEPCDIRFLGVIDVVGVLFDLRTGFFDPRSWGIEANAAVLVVRGVSVCRVPSLRSQMWGWEVSCDESSWSCRMMQWNTPGAVEIVGTSASLYGGHLPALPLCQPMLGKARPEGIRAGWVGWDWEFEMTVEPEHANPYLIGGYIWGTE